MYCCWCCSWCWSYWCCFCCVVFGADEGVIGAGVAVAVGIVAKIKNQAQQYEKRPHPTGNSED
jgi:hypothetical protein